ncbi:hypothetical protein RvY_09780 [Ramazzottius varieornatus]|uniref:Uncharacterized protein n=1 Tax=Ramazzottius varieornatus TaxID=947166 RepID=A0A1D1VIC6_RAMVA|nr:hypothetical protein RvY_09780 [Ramazzottius varieornatus]
MSKRAFDDLETDDEGEWEQQEYPSTQLPNTAATDYMNGTQAHSVKRRRKTEDAYSQARINGTSGWLSNILDNTSKWDGSTLLSSRPFAGQNSRRRLSASIARRHIDKDETDRGLFNVGKKVLSWAMGKIRLAPPTIDMNTTDNYPAGFSFSCAPPCDRPLSSTSLITDDGSRYDHSRDSRSRSPTPSKAGSTDEEYFTPINSPESDDHFKLPESKEERVPRRSILSPEPKRNSSGAKAKPRVSINRTPQVREIANRQQQAKKPQAIWEHRDLQPEECENFKHRIPGEITPDAEKILYLNDMPPLSSPLSLSNRHLLSDLTAAEPKDSFGSNSKKGDTSSPSGSAGRRPLSEIVLSPRTETANVMMDFAAQDDHVFEAPRPRSRASNRNLSFAQVMSLASAQQAVIETSMEMKQASPEGQKRQVTVSTPSPTKYLPPIPKRQRPSVIEAASVLVSIASKGNTLLSATSLGMALEDSSVGSKKRKLVLPRLMPAQPIKEAVDLSRFRRWPKLDGSTCLPAEVMLRRKSEYTPWLPPMFEDGDEGGIDEELDDDEYQYDVEGEEEYDELNEMADKSAGSTESEDAPSGSADDQSGNSDVTEIHLVEVDENSTDGATLSPPSSQPRKRRFSFDELRQRQLATFIRNISPHKSVNTTDAADVPLEMRDETLP